MKYSFLLLFTLALLSCNKAALDTNELSGSSWEIYQYKDPTSANPQSLQDTLIFTTHKAYTYNGISDSYTLTNSANQKMLSLYGSKFGDITGTISSDFNKYGEILGVTFSTLNTSDASAEYILWMRRIE